MSNELYCVRRRLSEIMNGFSQSVIGVDAKTGISDFKRDKGYHTLNFDRQAAARRFRATAPDILDEVIKAGPDLARELADAVMRQDGPYIGAIAELSWLVAFGNYAYAAFQITARRKQYILAQPVFAYYRNVDSRPLTLSLIELRNSFETRADLDLATAETVVLKPGESLFLNGFEQAVSFGESGVLLSMVSTLPVGAYEATFDSQTGAFVGLFSTEMRLSSIDVILRTMGAAGWQGVTDVAESVSAHPVRELRWASLNYMWQSDVPKLLDWLDIFAADPDQQISRIASQCRSQIRQAEAII